MNNKNKQPFEILLSQRFLPEKGGSITWLREICRRWHAPVCVITHRYKDSCPHIESLDSREANLIIVRRNILMSDWGIDSAKSILCYLRMFFSVGVLFCKHKQIRVHCAHAVPEVAGILPLKWLFASRVNIVCYVHGEEITACETSRQLTFFFKLALRAVDTVIANSENTKKLLLRHMRENKIKVVYPGVDLVKKDEIDLRRKSHREKNAINSETIVLFSLGRLEKRKNHAAVIRALIALNKVKNSSRNSTLNTIYYIAGVGREERELKNLTKALQLENSVFFLGEVDEEKRRDLLAACDIFIMPSIKLASDFEGFGMVFLEAAAFGRPCICGNTGGQREAVIDKKTGLVVDGTSTDEIANAISQLANNKQLREELGENAFARAQEFGFEKQTAKIAKAI